MCQGVSDLYFRALSFVSMVFQYEVYHPRAVWLEVTVFIVQRRVYLASSLLCFVGVVVDALLDKDVRCPVLWGTFPVRHGLSRLGECRDGRGQWGFSDLGHHAGVCWEVPVYGEHPRLVGVVGVREGQRERLFDLGYRLWVYGSGVVPEGVLGGVPVCLGGTSRGFHCLQREGVVKGDLVQVVGFCGPPCLPFRQCGVVLGAVQGAVDSHPLRVGVDGNVGTRCRVYPDRLCGSRLGRLVVVAQGRAFHGRRALGG